LGSGPTLFAALRGLWEYYELRARMGDECASWGAFSAEPKRRAMLRQ
jgi:hypothetical protein